MEKNTKERIMEEALKLFAQTGYAGTSMSEIAGQIGFSKAALYKHFASKQEILDSIIDRMTQLDSEYARTFGMPEGTMEESADAYGDVSLDKIRVYTKAMFAYWTEEAFSSDFRKMLTLEQYRDPTMNRLFHQYLAAGPSSYMKDVFRSMADSEEAAQGLALEFYGPVFLLYSIYDQAEDKQSVKDQLDRHVEQFMERNLK